MKIYKDIITGDEMFTDSNPVELIDDCLYEVTCTHISRKQGEIVLAGANPSAEDEPEMGGTDEQVESGLDLVLNQNLKRTQSSKADYKTYLKAYTKSLQDKWKAQGLTDEQLAEYKEKFMNAVKKILKVNLDEAEFYVGESFNPDGMVAVLDYRDKPDGSGEEAKMLFFKHGLECEKV